MKYNGMQSVSMRVLLATDQDLHFRQGVDE